MKVVKAEIDALQAVLMTPLEDFITEKEQAEHKDPEGLAQRRMFTKAIEAVDEVRGLRTGWVVVLRFGSNPSSVMYHSVGTWSTKAQADKATEGLLKALEATAYAVVPQMAEAGWLAALSEADAPPVESSSWAEVRRDAAALKKGWNPKKERRDKYDVA